jgi:hypothetical protein
MLWKKLQISEKSSPLEYRCINDFSAESRHWSKKKLFSKFYKHNRGKPRRLEKVAVTTRIVYMTRNSVLASRKSLARLRFLKFMKFTIVPGRFKGTVSPVQNGLKVVWFDRPWLRHQALTILKTFNCPFCFLWAFEVLKHLILKPFKFAIYIMKVGSKWQCTFSI